MNNEKTNRTEEILSSLDGIKRAAAPDFFYTRLKAKMQAGPDKGIETARPKPWALRPVYAMGAVILAILVNAAVIFSNSKSEETTALNEAESMQSIAAEYSVSDAGSLYDLNQEK